MCFILTCTIVVCLRNMTTLTVPPQGIVISSPGNYVLSGSTLFTGVIGEVPSGCVDPLTGAAVTGVLITANDVNLNLAGNTLKLAPSAAAQVREFSCLRVTGARVSITNGTLGRSTAFGLLAEGASNLTLENISIRDFEQGGIMVEGDGGGGGVIVSNCNIGPNFQGRRPGTNLSLAARYLPTLIVGGASSAAAQLEDELATAATSGPFFRSDLGECVGLTVRACVGLVNINDVTITNLSQRPVQVPFLALPEKPLPQGALHDPIPAVGAGPERRAAQEAAAATGLLPLPDAVPPCPAYIRNACSATATNLGMCSSCTSSRPAVINKTPRAELRIGLDGMGRNVVGVVGVQLELLSNYTLSNISVTGLLASLGVAGSAGDFACPTAIATGARARATTIELLLVKCSGGVVVSVPDPLLVQSDRPQGAPCNLPCGFSAAWSASGNSQTFARPVGNQQNIQPVPAFLPSVFLCYPTN